ncbi:hypothetical protein [Candidatus Nitrosotenuis cloacae]|nr:hypothetical protein [Candidatus Nitrosotenuis cloacae]
MKKPRTTCMCCGSEHAIIIPDHRYKGLRGFCYCCDGNWPES